MRNILLFVLILLTISKTLGQKTASCQIEKKQSLVINIDGDNNGKIFQAKTLKIGTLICDGCQFYYWQEKGALYLYNDARTAVAKNETKSDERPLFNIVEIKRKAIALNVLSGLPPNKQICIREFVTEKITQDHYQVFQTNDRNGTLLEIPVQEDELMKLGLKIIYPESEGITRIGSLGTFYYTIAEGEYLVKQKNGNYLPFSRATDFVKGSAIVGEESPNLEYFLLNNLGQKSNFSFTDFQESFANDANIIKIHSYSKYILVNRKMELLTKPYDEIVENNGLIQVKDTGKFGLFRNDNGEITELLPVVYDEMTFWEQSLMVVKKEAKNYLLDRKKNFAELLTSDYPIRQKKTNEYGIVVEANGKKGVFLLKDRRLIPLDYDDITVVAKEYAKCQLNGQYTYYNFDANRNIGFFENIADASDDKGFVKVQQKGKWGYISTSGYEIIKPLHETILDFDKKYDLAWASVGHDSTGLLERSGRFTLFPELMYSLDNERVSPFNKYGVSFVKPYGLSLGENYGVVSYKKQILAQGGKRKFTMLDTEIQGVGFVTDSSQTHFFVRDGEKITETYSHVWPQRANGDRVVSRGVYGPTYVGVLDKNLKEVIPCMFGSVEVLSDYLYKTKGFRQYDYRIYDNTGKSKGGAYSDIKPFVGIFAIAHCVERGGICVIDTSGNRYTNCMPYRAMSDVIQNQYSVIAKDNQKGIMDIHTRGKILPLSCDDINYEKGIFVCKKGGESFRLQPSPDSILLKCVGGDCAVYDALLRSEK